MRFFCAGKALPIGLVLGLAASALAATGGDELRVRVAAEVLDPPQSVASWADVWQVEREAGWALISADAEDLRRLSREGVAFDVDWDASRPVAPSADDLSCYLKVADVEAKMDEWAAAYPDLVEIVPYGESWDLLNKADSGSKLRYLRITDRSTDGIDKPVLFIMGAIHPREMATTEIVLKVVGELIAGFGTDPTLTGLLAEMQVIAIPIANPDGRRKADTGASWRKNTDEDDGCSAKAKAGTDLNRNSSYMWNHGGSSADPCSEVFRGPAAASEPEVRAIEDLFARFWLPRPNYLDDTLPADEEATAGLMVTFHSYGGWVLRPLGYRKAESPNERSLKAIGDRLAKPSGYRSGIASIAYYIASGATDDVSYGMYGIPSFTIEVGSEFFESCSRLGTVVDGNTRATLDALAIAPRPYRMVFGPTVTTTEPSRLEGWAGEPVRLAVHAEAASGVGAVRASVDVPVWRGGALIAGRAIDGSFGAVAEDAAVVIPGRLLSAGRHRIWIDGETTAGFAGPPIAIEIDVRSRTAPIEPARD